MSEEETEKFYPNVQIRETNDGQYDIIQLHTLLRKKHHGKWYFFPMTKQYSYEKLTLEKKIVLINNFHKEVYYCIILTKINLKDKNSYGQKYYTKDENQQSEVERLKKHFRIFK
jgi:hypothetical protein